MLDDVQRAGIERALSKLQADPNYSHSIAVIRRIAGDLAAKGVAGLCEEYRAANKDAKEFGGAMLSGEAADYWQEAQGVLRYARIALAGDDPQHRKEKALARKCERLEESFDARVPDSDKPKFIQFDPQFLGSQDSRWDWTVDGPFPLLSPQFTECLPVSNPMGEAQRVVLAALLDEPRHEDAQAANVLRLGAMLRRFTERFEEEERTAAAVAWRKKNAAKKRDDVAAKKATKDAQIAAGDQKVTKHIRGRKLKVVTDVFAIPVKPKRSRTPQA